MNQISSRKCFLLKPQKGVIHLKQNRMLNGIENHDVVNFLQNSFFFIFQILYDVAWQLRKPADGDRKYLFERERVNLVRKVLIDLVHIVNKLLVKLFSRPTRTGKKLWISLVRFCHLS